MTPHGSHARPQPRHRRGRRLPHHRRPRTPRPAHRHGGSPRSATTARHHRQPDLQPSPVQPGHSRSGPTGVPAHPTADPSGPTRGADSSVASHANLLRIDGRTATRSPAGMLDEHRRFDRCHRYVDAARGACRIGGPRHANIYVGETPPSSRSTCSTSSKGPRLHHPQRGLPTHPRPSSPPPATPPGARTAHVTPGTPPCCGGPTPGGPSPTAPS